jgi:hypothetical protein
MKPTASCRESRFQFNKRSQLFIRVHNETSGVVSLCGCDPKLPPIVIRVYDDAGNVIETHEHTGDFKEW